MPPFPRRFWYGDEALWTIAPTDGIWRGTRTPAGLHRDKLFWWSKHWDPRQEADPGLTVTARRMDGDAPEVRSHSATEAQGRDVRDAMMVGLDVPTAGCWEITGEYRGHTLSYVVWVPSGYLSSAEEVPVLEEVIRYAVGNAAPPCKNHGSKEAFCLSIGDMAEDPPSDLLRRLEDVRPPIVSLSECRRRGIVGARVQTVDPTVSVRWLEPMDDQATVRAHVVVSCMATAPIVRRHGARWVLEGAGGWIGCGPVPPDCIVQ